MGLKDIFKKASEVTKKAVDRAAKEVKWRKKVGEAKREILTRFTVRQLERIANSKRISLYQEDPFSGERERLRSKGAIVDRLASCLSFQEVVDLARKYKVRYVDVVQELERFRQQLFEEKQRKKSEQEILKEIYEVDEKLESTEKKIDIFDLLQDFRPETVRNEEDLEKQLYQFLRARLGNKVRRQAPVGDQKIDIAIDNEVGIELKIAESRSKLQQLVGQVVDYMSYFDEVIAVILDVGANVDIDDYIKKLRRLGAEVVILEGGIKRRGRSREIIIKDAGRKIIIR